MSVGNNNNIYFSFRNIEIFLLEINFFATLILTCLVRFASPNNMMTFF